MCPVLKLAVKRTLKVKGRTSNLTSSIKHKKGFKAVGEFAGNKWAKNSLILKEILARTIENQITTEIPKFMVKWLVSLNLNGIRPEVFINSKKSAILAKIDKEPPILFIFVRKIKSLITDSFEVSTTSVFFTWKWFTNIRGKINKDQEK